MYALSETQPRPSDLAYLPPPRADALRLRVHLRKEAGALGDSCCSPRSSAALLVSASEASSATFRLVASAAPLDLRRTTVVRGTEGVGLALKRLGAAISTIDGSWLDALLVDAISRDAAVVLVADATCRHLEVALGVLAERTGRTLVRAVAGFTLETLTDDRDAFPIGAVEAECSQCSQSDVSMAWQTDSTACNPLT